MPDAVMLLYKNNYPLIALDTLLNDEKFRMELLEKETDYFLVQSFESQLQRLQESGAADLCRIGQETEPGS